MPCQSSFDYNENYTQISYDELRKMKKELDLTTRLLCGLLKELDYRDQTLCDEILEDDRELDEWWDKHLVADRKRLKKQKEQRKRKLKEIKKWLLELDSDKQYLRKQFKRLQNLKDEDYDEREFNFKR